jgi:hypothetical protein
MAVVKGRDDQSGFGVLGAGSPSTTRNQDGDVVPVNSVGVFGVVGDPQGVDVLVDFISNDFKQFVNAAVAGAVPDVSSGGIGTNAFGFLAGNDPRTQQPTGVYGESSHQGVVGISNGPGGLFGLGVLGVANQSGSDFDPATGGSGVLGSGYIGVRGETQSGVAVLGRVFGSGIAGLFQGDVRVTASVSVDGDVLLANKDLAERFPCIGPTACEPGTVMVIDGDGKLAPCVEAYDRRAIGVVSGAAGNPAAITLGAGDDPQATVSIALVGTVQCRVDADLAPIASGDLVTTSSTPGHGMKASDVQRSFGAVIGKALGALPAGRGLIPLLVSPR